MHEHHLHTGVTTRVLTWSLAATVAFIAVELYSGVQAHSLALISDAAHNFTDALALLLALLGLWLQGKPADEVKTYGYHRAGVLAAFVNALMLLGASLYLIWESVRRFRSPQPVREDTMLVVAGLGLLLNVAILFALRHAHHDDLNVRAASVHMLSDALGSVAIILGAVVLHFTGHAWIDPVLSIFISGLIIWSAVDITRDSLNILLEGLPKGLRLSEVVETMRSVPGVLDVHDLHIWSLGSTSHALSCHVLIDDVPPSESAAILERINRVLAERYHIHHTTVQFEHVSCELSARGCSIPAQRPGRCEQPSGLSRL